MTALNLMKIDEFSKKKKKKKNAQGKGAICSFPIVFSKDLYCKPLKIKACLRKGLKQY